jgi:hypothetical protein
MPLPAHLADLATPGTTPGAAEDRVWVIQKGNGYARTVPASQYQQALAEGDAPANNAEEIAKAQERERIHEEATSGVGGALNATVEGIARAIPGADYLARKGNELLLGKEKADEINEAVKARSETGWATAGEAAGIVGLTLAGGGGLAAGGRTGAKGALAAAARNNPVALINRASEGAGAFMGGLAQRAVPSPVLGQILAKGTALGTEGALQGMAFQVGHNINEEALGDANLTAEKLYAGLGEAALFGGLLGGGLGLAAGTGKAVARRAVDDLAPLAGSAERAATAGLDAAAEEGSILRGAIKRFAKWSEPISGKSADDIETALTKSNVRRDAAQYEPLKRAAVEEAVAGLDKIQALERVEKQLAAGEFKLKNVAASVRRGEDVVVNAMAKVKALDDATAALEPVVQQGKRSKLVPSTAAEEMGARDAAALRRLVKHTQGSVEKALKSPDREAALYMALDDFKRGISKVSAGAQKDIQRGADSVTREQKQRFFETVEVLRRDVRDHLEDAAQWGQQGVNQQRMNKAITKYMDTKPDFDNRVYVTTSERAEGPMWALKKREADAAKIDQYFSSLDDWRKNKQHEQTIRHLDSKEEAFRALEELDLIPDGMAEEFAAARAANKQFRGAIHTQAERLGNANMVRKLIQSDGDGMGAIGSAVGGSLLGGPVGAAAGFAFGALSNPGRLVKQMMHVEAMAQQVARFDRTTRRAMTDFVKGATDKTGQSLPRAGTRLGAKAERAGGRVRALRQATTALVGAELADRQRSFQRKTKQIKALAADPALAVESAGRLVSGLDRSAPKTTQALTQTHLNTIAYLDRMIPTVPESIRNRGRREAWRPAPAQMVPFERAYRAIVDPLTVLSDLRNGTVTMEAVNALKETKPKLWEDFRSKAIEAVELHPGQLDHSALVKLSLVFDFAGDSTLDAGFLSRHQARVAQPVEEAPPEPGASAPPPTTVPDFSAAVRNPTERIMQAL